MQAESLSHRETADTAFLTTVGKVADSVPLLCRSSAGRNPLLGHCFCEAVARCGEKCGLTPQIADCRAAGALADLDPHSTGQDAGRQLDRGGQMFAHVLGERLGRGVGDRQ